MNALPPHTPPAAGTGFDVDADVAALKSAPKQETAAPEPDPGAPPEGAPTPDAPPTGAPGGNPGTGDADPEAGGDGGNAKASAKEFIEAYDMLQCWSFAAFSGGMKPEEFQLPAFAKTRAAHHLAKGLEKMGSPELPWWLGLLIALAPPAGINFMTAKAHREAKEANEARAANAAKHARSPGDPIPPTTITRPDGTEIRMRPVAQQERTAPPPAAPRSSTAPMPPCGVCGNPVKNRKRKYCSTHCGGVASGRKNQERAARNKPTTIAQP